VAKLIRLARKLSFFVDEVSPKPLVFAFKRIQDTGSMAVLLSKIKTAIEFSNLISENAVFLSDGIVIVSANHVVSFREFIHALIQTLLQSLDNVFFRFQLAKVVLGHDRRFVSESLVFGLLLHQLSLELLNSVISLKRLHQVTV
jgi:hypothetical protein